MNYPVTKTEQSKLVDNIIQPLLDGMIDPIEFITKVKGLAAALSEVEKNKSVKDIVLKEIEKHGKTASWNGATLVIKETGVRYDFSQCNDPIYLGLISKKQELDAQIKDREAFLKTIPDNTTFLDEETGEYYKLHPAARTASESFSITFKK